MALPSLSGLEAFEVVARLGSFTAAARELHITQSAVSHRVRALEAQLGAPLFHRGRRGVELSEAGRALGGACAEGFAALRSGVARVRTQRGVLTVSCSPSFALFVLVPGLPSLRAAHPDLDVRVQALDALATPGLDGVDVCVRYGPGGYRGVLAQALGPELVHPVCAPAVAERLRTPRDLRGETLLHDDVLREHEGHVGWDRWVRAAGVEAEVDPEAGHRFSHAHLAIEAAAAGHGVVLGRATLVRRDLAHGRLVRPFDLGVESGLRYYLVLPRGALTPALDAFGSWLFANAA